MLGSVVAVGDADVVTVEAFSEERRMGDGDSDLRRRLHRLWCGRRDTTAAAEFHDVLTFAATSAGERERLDLEQPPRISAPESRRNHRRVAASTPSAPDRARSLSRLLTRSWDRDKLAVDVAVMGASSLRRCDQSAGDVCCQARREQDGHVVLVPQQHVLGDQVTDTNHCARCRHQTVAGRSSRRPTGWSAWGCAAWMRRSTPESGPACPQRSPAPSHGRRLPRSGVATVIAVSTTGSSPSRQTA